MTRSALLGLFLCVGLAAPAAASTMLVSVTFDGTLTSNSGIVNDFDDLPVELEASFLFDPDEPLGFGVPTGFPPGSSGVFFSEFELESFSLTPATIGTTTFGIADVGVQLGRETLVSPLFLVIGPTADGIGFIADQSDSFVVVIEDPFGVPDLDFAQFASADGQSGFGFNFNSNISVNTAVIPEPTTLLLAGLGGPAAWLVRRRRAG